MSSKADKKSEIDIAGVSDNLSELAKEEQAAQGENSLTGPLANFAVGISISESEEIEQLGLSDVHQKDYMIEIARHLLVQDAILAYGGDLRDNGYTKLFAELSYQYRNKNDRNRFPFRNYFSYPYHINLDKSGLTELKVNRVEVIKVAPAPELGIDSYEFIKPITLEGKYIWTRSLSFMRQKMNNETDARIFIGGRNYNYKGKYPGIVEEAYFAFKSNKPVYLVGAFGGATSRIVGALSGKSVIDTANAFYQTESQHDFVTFHNQQVQDDFIDFDLLNSFFNSKTIDWLSKNNGLSVNDNIRLFNTPHLSEAVYLIMKGLNQMAKRL